MKFSRFVILFLSVFALSSCTTEKQIKEQVTKILKENPSMIFEAIESRPVEFLEVVQKAAKTAQEDQRRKEEEKMQDEYDTAFKNPIKPKFRSDESFRGDKNAPLVLVEYSDFECPYCRRGFEVVQELRKKYGDKITFIYKHLPLSFHRNAMVAAQYYEAIRLQDNQKAWKFHDKVFDEQDKLQKGEGFLKAVAQEAGADMKKLAKDLESKAVEQRIEEDMQEAAQFGFQGTPGFIFNGVPVKGAYPAAHFEKIVEELKSKGLLKL